MPTAQDISHIPPIDRNGEMRRASTLLDRFRKALDDKDEKPLSAPWKKWIASSLLAGIDGESGLLAGVPKETQA
jgi:hypothetical protein